MCPRDATSKRAAPSGHNRQRLPAADVGREPSSAASQGSCSAIALRGSAITSRMAFAYSARIDTRSGAAAGVRAAAALHEDRERFMSYNP